MGLQSYKFGSIGNIVLSVGRTLFPKREGEFMNLLKFVFYGLGLFVCFRLLYEVWFTPERFHKRINSNRKSAKNFFGFSFWNKDKANINSARFAYTFIAIIFFLGLIASIVSSR